jgi:hypothetical protein
MRVRRFVVASVAVASLSLAQGCAARGDPATEPAPAATAKKPSALPWELVTAMAVGVAVIVYLIASNSGGGVVYD